MAKVTLLTHTPMPEQTIAAAAKLCYSAAEIDKIYEGLTPEKPPPLWKCCRRSDTRAY
ncbi:MAG: hypothetical protein ACLRQY_00740 [[Clostridium] leptum]